MGEVTMTVVFTPTLKQDFFSSAFLSCGQSAQVGWSLSFLVSYFTTNAQLFTKYVVKQLKCDFCMG